MTNKEYILDCLINGGEHGECETQIKEYFEFVEVSITIEEIRKLISEMINSEFIYVNKTWTNEHGETPYAVTQKGKEAFSKIS